jgi:hypothetical protein
VGIDPASPRHLRRTTLIGRPAVEVAGARPSGWAVVIVTRGGSDLVLMQLAAPSRFDYDRASPTWRTMVRSVQPVPMRSYRALGYPPDNSRDPGWGSSEEGLR